MTSDIRKEDQFNDLLKTIIDEYELLKRKVALARKRKWRIRVIQNDNSSATNNEIKVIEWIPI